MSNTDVPYKSSGEYKGIPLYKTQVGDLTVNFAKIGSGPVLVLVHGLTNNWYGWGPTIDYLKEDFTLYVPDLPGYGYTDDLTDEQYSIEQQAYFIVDFIHSISEDVTAVVGISMGSSITGEVGRIMGDELQAIVMVSPVLRIGRRTNALIGGMNLLMWVMGATEMTSRLLKYVVGSRIVSHALSKYVNMYNYQPALVDEYGIIGKRLMRARTYPQMSRSVSSYNLLGAMSNYNRPALMIYGQNDKVSEPMYAHEYIARRQSSVKVCEIPEAGHWVQVEKPKEVAESITKYLHGVLS